VLDNLNTHRGTHIDAWLAAHPGRLVIYYLPFHASWLNQIELSAAGSAISWPAIDGPMASFYS
jgi:DDE superfamily endonuclease